MMTTEHTGTGSRTGQRTQLAWAVYNERCGFFLCTISDSCPCAIMEHADLQRITWDQCRQRGDRVVRIRIEVLP